MGAQRRVDAGGIPPDNGAHEALREHCAALVALQVHAGDEGELQHEAQAAEHALPDEAERVSQSISSSGRGRRTRVIVE